MRHTPFACFKALSPYITGKQALASLIWENFLMIAVHWLANRKQTTAETFAFLPLFMISFGFFALAL